MGSAVWRNWLEGSGGLLLGLKLVKLEILSTTSENQGQDVSKHNSNILFSWVFSPLKSMPQLCLHHGVTTM